MDEAADSVTTPLLSRGAGKTRNEEPADVTAAKILALLQGESNRVLKFDPAGQGWDQEEMVGC